MNMKNILLLLLVILSCASQNSRKSEPVLFNLKDENKVFLSSKIILKDSLKLPMRLAVDAVNDKIFLTSANHKKWFRVYDAKTGFFINDFGVKGQGPGEIMNATELQFFEDMDKVFVHDLTQRKVTSFSLSEIYKGSRISAVNSYSLDKTRTFYPKFVGEDVFVDLISSYSGDTEHRLQRINGINQRVVKKGGKYPQMAYPKQSEMHKSEIFTAFMNTNRFANHFVLAYGYTDYIDVFDRDFNHISSIKGSEGFLPLLKASTNEGATSVMPQKDSRLAFTIPAVGEDKFYVLYDGRSTSTRDYHQKYLLSFDLKGTLLSYYELDVPIFAFDIDWDDEVIYGLTHEHPDNSVEVAVVAFDLNK